MSATLWIRLIDEIVEIAPKTVVLPFWRGESLLHPDFSSLLSYALDRNIRIHLATNGHAVTGEQFFILQKCEFVTFSIHTIAGYEHAKKLLALKRNGRPTLQISFVRGERTTEQFLHKLVSSPDLEGFDSVRLYEEHTKDGVFGKSAFILDQKRTFCPKLRDTLVIAYDGAVSRCNHIWNTEKEIDMHYSSIVNAWVSPRLGEVRRNYPDAHCSCCDQWTGHTCGESWRLYRGVIKHKIFIPSA